MIFCIILKARLQYPFAFDLIYSTYQREEKATKNKIVSY